MSRKFAVVSVFVFCLLSLGTAIMWAADNDDGRINVGPHAGGNAVYCVDANQVPGAYYSEGGIKVLSTEGIELLFAPGDTVEALVDQANRGELAENTLVVSEPGPYGFGMLSFYVLTDGRFQLNGYDEHGSAYAFIWTDCIPVYPAVSVHSTPTPVVITKPL